MSLLGVSCVSEKDSDEIGKQDSLIGATKSTKIAELINAYDENRGFSGTVLVAEKGEIIYNAGVGFANKELEVLNHSNTKHRIGSLTKQFTAMMILQLVEEKRIQLNATIDTYIPNYPRKGGNKITIHHLLTHSSGIPRFRLDKYRDPYTTDELLNLWEDKELDFEPGEQFAYSNPGYFLLGVIIEKVRKKPYEQVLQEYILNPLGMKNTGYDRHKNLLKNRSSGYVKQGLDYENAGYTDMSVSYAAGAIYSTVEDMYLWDQALYSDKLLSSEFRALLFKSHIPALGRFYGYGWFNSKYPIGNTKDSTDVIEHSGGIEGYSARITRITSKKNLVVILSNVQGTATRPLTFAINGILNSKSYDLPKKSFADALFDVISKKGISASLTFYSEYKNSEIYDVDESEIDNVGYQLFKMNKVNAAYEIFKINTQLFPESSNAYDLLGEVCVLLKKQDEAIESYKKSLSINPKNSSTIKILKTLE